MGSAGDHIFTFAMAKLHERPVIEEIDEGSDPTRFDADLDNVLTGLDHNAEEFLTSVFDFLDRRVRFFKQPGAAKKVSKLVDSLAPATANGKGVKGGFFGQASGSTKGSKVCAGVFTQTQRPQACCPILSQAIVTSVCHETGKHWGSSQSSCEFCSAT